MHTEELFVRCYVEKHRDLWVAVCVDLSLAAQANSLDDVVQKLNAQIADYVTEAYADKRYTKQLLSRKAPLAQRLRFQWIKLAMRLHLIKQNVSRAFESALPLRLDNNQFA